MNLFGMDTSEIVSVAKSLGRQSGDLRTLTADMEKLVRQAVDVWDGDDSDQFLEWWETEHRPALLKAQALIERLSGVAHEGVVAQERASSA